MPGGYSSPTIAYNDVFSYNYVAPATILTSPAGKAMLALLPQNIYAASTYLASVLQAQGVEVDALVDAITQVLNAAYVANAPVWALALWERELGIPTIGTGLGDATLVPRGLGALQSVALGQPDSQRRAQINARLAFPTVPTIAALLALDLTFFDGPSLVYEDIPNETVYFNFTAYGSAWFDQGVIPRGLGTTYTLPIQTLPLNWQAVLAQTRAYLPAHLDEVVIFNINGLTWDQLDALNWTWDFVDHQHFSWNQFEVL